MAMLIETAAGSSRRFELGDTVTIGRDASNDLQLLDPRVSRRHAEIRRTPSGRYRVVDLGSLHGTRIGPQRVTEAVLSDGDELVLGAIALRFVEDHGDDRIAGWLGEPTATGFAERVMRSVDMDDLGEFRPGAELVALDELRRNYEKLRAANRLTRAIGAERDLDALLDRILATAFNLFPADRAAILLYEPERRRVARARDGHHAELAISQTVIDEVVAHRAAVLSPDVAADARFNRAESILEGGIRSTMCVPMLHDGNLLGAMLLTALGRANAFDEGDLDILSAIAGEAALAISNLVLRRRVEEMALAENRRLAAALRDLPVGVVVLDEQRRVRLANDRAAELLPLLSPVDGGAPVARLGAVSIDELLARPQGTAIDVVVDGPPRRVVSASAAPSRDGGREIVVALRDVTVERDAEARHVRTERLALLGQLAGGIAHDFNHVLCVIRAAADLAVADLGDHKARADVESIRDATAQGVHLSRQLMAFGRQQPSRPEIVDVDAVVKGMSSLMQRTLGDGIELATRLAAAPSSVEADAGKLEQVLLNLVVNARDAMAGQGRLAVETAGLTVTPARPHAELAAGRYVELRVADTGRGMTPAIAARAFEPFFTTKDESHGTGLGLATVYAIVKQAGGAVWFDTAPGAGTTFHVALPAVDASPRRARTPTPGPSTVGAARTVLVVDDQHAVRSLVRRTLARVGYRVLEAPGGAEALALFDATPAVDVLLTDLVMPGMSGGELVGALRARKPSLPVVYLTGCSTHETLRDHHLGDDPLIVEKPFERDRLVAAIEAAIAAKP